MNHKRKGPKSTRSGCLLCKPHKRQGNGLRLNTALMHRGFGKIRDEIHQLADLRQAIGAGSGD